MATPRPSGSPAGIFMFGAIFTSTLLRSGAQELDPAGAPAMAH